MTANTSRAHLVALLLLLAATAGVAAQDAGVADATTQDGGAGTEAPGGDTPAGADRSTGPAVGPASAEALFDTQLGDAEVDLFAVGSWNTGIGGTLGWAFHPAIPPEDNRVTFPYDFPGMETVPYFNAVDLTLSLWLYERYYLETTFADEFEINSFILGYQGQQDEFVQSVRLGYGLLSISQYPYIPVAEATDSSPGASAAFATQRSEHEFLLRYEPSAEQRKIFYGMNEAAEKRIDPAGYLRGRFFVLPDADVENLTLYLEDADGSIVGPRGGAWREADLDAEAVYSAEKGFIYLREKAAGRVAVHYTKGGSGVGTPGLGIDALVGVDDGGTPGDTADDVLDPSQGPYDFSFGADPYGAGTYLGLDLSTLSLSLGGDQALLLHEPGAFNPFEIANRYDIADLASAEDLETEFVRKGEYADIDVPGQIIATNDDQTLLSVINADRGPRHHSNRYPFAEDFPELYGPDPTDKPGYTDFQILATGLTPVNQLTIDGNVVPGSVTVLRNGVEDPSFEVNYESGVLTSPAPVYPSDVIEVVYRVYGSGGGGDLLLATGNRIELGPQTNLSLALGSRWNVVRGNYSVSPTDHPGSVTASAALDHETDYFSGYLDGAVQLSVPDTTGYLRLLGMEQKETEIPAADGNMFPAAAPGTANPGDPASAGSDPTATWDSGLDDATRGRLFYRDYYDEGAFGGRVLRDYDWNVPGDQSYPYAAGSRIGPYPATAEDDGIDGQVMVLDFDIDGGAGEDWVGAHLRMPDFADRDFSEITEISFSWRTLDIDGTEDDIEVYLQIGSLAEDLDGDGDLDRGESTLSPAFDFDDANAGFTLNAGRPPPGEDYRMSEDGNRNGVLDTETAELVHTLSDGVASDLVTVGGRPDDEWRRLSFDLDAAARRKIAATRAVRVVVKSASGGSVSGRALFSKLTLRGSTFQTEATGGTVRATEVPDTGAPRKLTDEHDEVADVFHADDRGNQRVLRVEWSGFGGSDAWTLSDYVTPVPARQYEVLAFYARVGNMQQDGGPDTDVGDGALRVTLSGTNPDGGSERLRAVVPVDEDDADQGSAWRSGRWRKVELDTAAGKVYVDGDEVGSLEGRPSGGATDLSFLELEFVEGTDAAEGTIYIDEVHWAETRISVSGASRLALTYEYPDTIVQAGEVEVLSNVQVSQDTSVRTGGFATDSEVADGVGSFYTRTGLAGDLLYTRLETDLQVSVQNDRTSMAGGHSLRVPAADAPVVFTESFRRSYNAPFVSLYRSNGLLFTLPLDTRLRLDSAATLREENLDQSWDLDASTDPGENWELGLTTGLGHSAAGYDPGSASYPESWVLGYELLAPYSTGAAPTREGTASISVLRSPIPVGTELDVEAAYENRSSTEREQTNEAAVSVAIPLSFARDTPRAWTITPSYGRSFERTLTAASAASYGDDLGVYGSAFAGQQYLATATPVAELFQSAGHIGFAGRSAGEPFARYTPRLGLSLERSFGSRLRDLVLPAAADLGIERAFTREEEAVTELQRFTASYTATAVNLFGRVGAYPTFDIYRTDEFSTSLSGGVERRFPAEETAVNGEVSSLVALFGEQENEFQLENRAAGTIDRDTRSLSVESEARYVRQRPAERLFGLERLVEDRPPYYRHTERAAVLYDAPGGEDGERSYSLTLGHETRLVFPEHGFIRLYADLGFGLQPAVIDGEEVNVVLLGMQGGIEGRIEF